MHALIIEDEALIGLAIQDVLADIGFISFDFASCADTAVAAARRRRPDLITADVQLAPGNGIDAVEAICCEKAVPVVFITGTAAEARRRCPNDIVLDKPFSSRAIAEAVRAALAQAR